MKKPSNLQLAMLVAFWFVVLACSKKDDPSVSIIPSVFKTGLATNVTGNTAKLSGNVITIGTKAISDYGIVYAKTNNPTTADSKVSLGTLTAPKDFTTDLSGLSLNTTYFFKIYITNTDGTLYGDAVTFKTLDSKAPVVTTGTFSGITATAFSVNGKITDIGTAAVIEYGHCLSATNQIPTLTDTKMVTGTSASTGKDFKTTFTALLASTSYYVRSYATNSVGTAYGDVVQVKTEAVIQNDLVFIGSNDKKVYALDAATGTKKWEFTTGGEVRSSPTYVDGVVYVGSNDKKLYALDAKTGIKKWEFTTGGAVHSTPLYAKSAFTNNEGIVFISSLDSKIYAVNAATGAKKWEFLSDNNLYCSPITSPDNQFIMVSSANFKQLYGLDTKTGAKVFETTLNAALVTGTPYSPIMGEKDILYTVGQSSNSSGQIGALYAIDAKTGVKKWEYINNEIATDRQFQSSPTMADGLVFLTDLGGRLTAINAETGVKKWRNDAANLPHGQPVVVDGILFSSSNKNIIAAYNTNDGSQKWSFSSSGNGDTGVAIANGIVYCGTDALHKVVAVDGLTGKLKWEFVTGASIFSSPCVLAKDGKVFYPGTSGMQH